MLTSLCLALSPCTIALGLYKHICCRIQQTYGQVSPGWNLGLCGVPLKTNFAGLLWSNLMMIMMVNVRRLRSKVEQAD